MKTLKHIGRLLFLAASLSMPHATIAAGIDPGGPSPDIMLDQWSFHATNWYSDYGHAPVAYTNIANLTNILWIDTADSEPAYLFYKVIESSGATNIICSNGTISLWVNFDWSSSGAVTGSTGPQDWANLISLGEYGTNGSSWWAWYLDANGTNIYFSAQTNGGYASNYLIAPVTFLSGNWYNLVLTYSASGSAFYTNGVLVTNGTGVAYWPGPDVTFFAMGSDSNGFHQSESLFSYIQTYNYPLDPYTIAGNFGMMSVFYGITPSNAPDITSAPSTESVVPVFDAVTGPGFLVAGASISNSPSTNIWITNYNALVVSSNVIDLFFAVGGGSNGVPYDVFVTPNLTKPPLSNATWFWMGQAYKGTNYTLPVTNLPPNGLCMVLGTPQDSYTNGLTDAYEELMLHKNPAVPTGDGMLDGWTYLYGLSFTSNSTTNPAYLSTYTYDSVGRLDLITGIRTETLTNDAEGNVVYAH